jgi:hypothetical protein
MSIDLINNPDDFCWRNCYTEGLFTVYGSSGETLFTSTTLVNDFTGGDYIVTQCANV